MSEILKSSVAFVSAFAVLGALITPGQLIAMAPASPNEDPRAHLITKLQAKSSEVSTMQVDFDLYRAQDVAMNPGELEQLLLDGLATGAADKTFAAIEARLDRSGTKEQGHKSRFVWDGARRLEETYGTLAVDDGAGLIRKSDVNHQITIGTRTHLPYKTLDPSDFRQSLRPDWLTKAEHLGRSPGGILFSSDLSEFTIDPETALSRLAVKRAPDGSIVKLYAEIGTQEPASEVYFGKLVVDATFKDAATIKLISAILINRLVVNEPVDESTFVVRADEGTLFFDVSEGVHPEKSFPIAATDNIRQGVTRTEGKLAPKSLLGPSWYRSWLFWINVAFAAVVATLVVVRSRLGGAGANSAS